MGGTFEFTPGVVEFTFDRMSFQVFCSPEALTRTALSLIDIHYPVDIYPKIYGDGRASGELFP